jgi:two-component system, cell cycle response regulator
MEQPDQLHALMRGLDVLDSLTGVYHRRYLDEKLPEAMLLCRKRGQSLSLIYADIDRFTWINERYGRVAGDLVLQHVAQTLQKRSRRPESWVARYDADAVVICLPGVRHAMARRLAGNLRVAVTSERLPLDGEDIMPTCCFVVKTVELAGSSFTAQELLLQAQEKAALAKQAGGNMIV